MQIDIDNAFYDPINPSNLIDLELSTKLKEKIDSQNWNYNNSDQAN